MRRRSFDSSVKERRFKMSKTKTDLAGMKTRPSRRALLQTVSAGFGSLAFSALLGEAAAAENPLRPKQPHFQPRAKRIIFLFMEGAISSLDTFEYKADIEKNGGKSGPGGGVITPSKFQFKQYGKTGSWFSELLPNIATHADELCWLRGL